MPAMVTKQNDRHSAVNRQQRCASAAAALPLPEKRKWSRVGPAHCHARKSDSSVPSRGPSSDPASSDDYDDDLDFEDVLSPPPLHQYSAYSTPCESSPSGATYSAPVRFRSSPPLEALKPLGATGSTCAATGGAYLAGVGPYGGATVAPVMVLYGDKDATAKSVAVRRESPVVIVRRDSEEGGASGGGAVDWTVDAPMEVRSLSPPTKVFHCSVSPKRRSARPSSSYQTRGHRHTHRPCLDFDKMQQLKARSVPAWRHGGERGGDLSVFCW